MGSTQGLDTDLCAGASWCHKLDWNALAHTFYTQTLVYSLQMTDALLSNGRFRAGGNSTHWPWPHGGEGAWIQYRQRNGAVFLPAVMMPPPGSAKSAPTTLSPTRVRVFAPSGGDLQWILPSNWAGKSVKSTAVTPGGRVDGPRVVTSDGTLNMFAVPKATPVILEAIL